MIRVRGLSPGALAELLWSRPPRTDPTQPLRVFLCVADHFEPKWRGAGPELQKERLRRWRDRWPALAERFRDSDGRPPQQTFFYAADQYEPEHAETLAAIRRAGFGDVEVHLHHDDDTADGLREKLLWFTDALWRRHGLLARDRRGVVTYGFMHGDWALDNSGPGGRGCGVNNELDVLRETGCYADFTLPSAPSPTQTRTVNAIYYAKDDPQRPKSHDRGVPARVGCEPPDDSLLLIQGPLAVDWTDRFGGVLPRIDYCNLQGRRGPSLDRLLRWVDAGVVVRGQPNWRFVKVHTHGCQEANAEILLGEPMRAFHTHLAEYARKNPGFRYHYVTAREMAALVRQAEHGALAPTLPVKPGPRLASGNARPNAG